MEWVQLIVKLTLSIGIANFFHGMSQKKMQKIIFLLNLLQKDDTLKITWRHQAEPQLQSDVLAFHHSKHDTASKPQCLRIILTYLSATRMQYKKLILFSFFNLNHELASLGCHKLLKTRNQIIVPQRHLIIELQFIWKYTIYLYAPHFGRLRRMKFLSFNIKIHLAV